MGSIIADMAQLQIVLSLTFETKGEGVHLHLKEIFQKQVSSGFENAFFLKKKIRLGVKLPKSFRPIYWNWLEPVS